MQSYILDSLNRFKRFSKRLDVTTDLSNRSWMVINDSNEKEILIFQKNGKVVYSINGLVSEGTWLYIVANDSIILKVASSSYMLHPSFYDENLIILNLDGTNQSVFFIDENRHNALLRNLSEIKQYLEIKEIDEIKVSESQKGTEDKTELFGADFKRMIIVLILFFLLVYLLAKNPEWLS